MKVRVGENIDFTTYIVSDFNVTTVKNVEILPTELEIRTYSSINTETHFASQHSSVSLKPTAFLYFIVILSTIGTGHQFWRKGDNRLDPARCVKSTYLSCGPRKNERQKSNAVEFEVRM